MVIPEEWKNSRRVWPSHLAQLGVYFLLSEVYVRWYAPVSRHFKELFSVSGTNGQPGRAIGIHSHLQKSLAGPIHER